MTEASRFLIVCAASRPVALGGSAHARAGANGRGYPCPGFEARRPAYGISAYITSLDAFSGPNGHITCPVHCLWIDRRARVASLRSELHAACGLGSSVVRLTTRRPAASCDVDGSTASTRQKLPW